jgi:signal transduction histidine kinase
VPVTEHRKPRPVEVVSLVGGVSALTALSLWPWASHEPWAYAIAALSAAAALVQVWRPVTGALAATVLAVLSPVATPAATVGVLQTAWRGRFRTAAAVAAAGVLAHLLQWRWHPNPALGFDWWAVLVTVAYGALLGWGTLARSHRDLVYSLRERARRAEAEQGRRVAEARAAERRALAREMHDVLAHRLTLVATYAGAIEYRPDASPERLSKAAGIVREGVHQAFEELRQVIGLLNEGDDGAAAPDLHALPALLDEARDAGQRLRVRDERPDAPLPAAVGRTAYRVLQEGLTNARKHAPGTEVDVALEGAPGTGLTVELRNPLPEPGAAPAAPGAGLGLVGLTERVRLAGGTLDHGTEGGRFRLRARLPWPT